MADHLADLTERLLIEKTGKLPNWHQIQITLIEALSEA